MRKYNIDFYKTIDWLIPHFLKKRKMRSWLRALIAPLRSLHNLFLSLVEDTRYKLSINGQVCYLELLLNDRFDPIQRRIYIANGNFLVVPPYLYNKIEARPQTLYNKSEGSTSPYFLHNRIEYNSSTDFIIYVPFAVPLTQEKRRIIRALVNQYRIAGKRFTITTF